MSIERGRELFEHSWTQIEGVGHRNAKGVIDLSKAERMGALSVNFEVFATPAVTSCVACHNVPDAIPGGSGQIITNVIVVRKSSAEPRALKGPPVDEVIVNASAPPSMFGSGFVDMLARQMTQALRDQRDALKPGESVHLQTQGISFGLLERDAQGNWVTSSVEGLPEASLISRSNEPKPSLQIRPFHQTGSIASLREFTINAFDFHLGIQASERFGRDTDPDRDGVINELSAQQLSDIVAFQAALPVPIQVLPDDITARQQIMLGEQLFARFDCDSCHRPTLVLENDSWIFKDTGAKGNVVSMLDLTAAELEGPRPSVQEGNVKVAVYSDFKLHDITDGMNSRDRDELHMHSPIGSDAFFAGTNYFITARLWGVGNQPPYFHHGHHTSLREAIESHGGEAAASRRLFRNATNQEQMLLLEFLQSLKVKLVEEP